MKRLLFYVILSALCLPSVQAGHLTDQLLFAAKLSGSEEVPPVTTDANGVAAFKLNSTKDSLCINIAVTGLSGPITGIHVHEAAAGMNGGVAWNLTPYIDGTRIATSVAINSEELSKLMMGWYYVNVHTDANPGGEIRGQLWLESDKSTFAWLDESYISSGASGYGLALLNLGKQERLLDVYAVTYGLTGPITAAHLHSVATGGVVVGLDSLITGTDNDMLWGTIDASTFMTDSLDGGYYLVIHTGGNPGGEIAGLTMQEQTYLNFDAMMDASFLQGTSPAWGLAQFRINPTMDTVWYHLAWDSLEGSFAGAHIHESGGSVAIDLSMDTIGTNAIAGWSSNITPALISELITGDAYVVVHSSANPNGEIAGNVYRLAREGYVANIDDDQTDPMVTSTAVGTGIVSIDRNQSNAHFMIAVDGLSGAITMAHFHLGVMGESGAVLSAIPFMNNGAYGYWNDTSAMPFMMSNSVQFREDSVYINIHTAANASGEARGQVLRDGNCFQIMASTNDNRMGANALSIYPNPATEIVNVTGIGEQNGSVEVNFIDLRGRVLKKVSQQTVFANGEITIPVTDLPTGLYMVQVRNGLGQISTGRVIVE